MKIVSVPIECIAWFDKEGKPIPLKFKIISDEGNKVVKLNQVVHMDKEKLAGNYMYVFDCQSAILLKTHSLEHLIYLQNTG